MRADRPCKRVSFTDQSGGCERASSGDTSRHAASQPGPGPSSEQAIGGRKQAARGEESHRAEPAEVRPIAPAVRVEPELGGDVFPPHWMARVDQDTEGEHSRS